MENVFIRIHRTEIFQSFMLQLEYKWDFERPADVERVRQLREVFDIAYEDVSSKKIRRDGSISYIECREYICKHW